MDMKEERLGRGHERRSWASRGVVGGIQMQVLLKREFGVLHGI